MYCKRILTLYGRDWEPLNDFEKEHGMVSFYINQSGCDKQIGFDL